MRRHGTSMRRWARCGHLPLALAVCLAAAACGCATALAIARVPAAAAAPVAVSTSAGAPVGASPAAGVLTSSATRQSTTVRPQSLRLTVCRSVALGWVPVRTVAVATAPRAIRVGISCGMASCGQNPCLCGGPVDRWGDCACNGFRTVVPRLSLSSANGGVVRVLTIGRRQWLLPTGVGNAVVTVHGTLKHYAATEAAVVVTVSPVAFITLGLAAVVLIGAAGAVVLVVVVGLRRLRGRREGAGRCAG